MQNILNFITSILAIFSADNPFGLFLWGFVILGLFLTIYHAFIDNQRYM